MSIRSRRWRPEVLADCMAYRWGYLGTGSYAGKDECASLRPVVDDLLAGRAPART